MSKNCCGPGYATPLDALHNGPREKLLYVVTVQPNLDEPHGDYLSTIDVDPASPTYSQIIHRTFTNATGNELHHSGWNTCSSCHNVPDGTSVPKRDKLVLPSLNSNNIYIVDVAKDPRHPEIHKVIDGSVLLDNDVSAPHTAHCLANGNVMISTMGDREGRAKGEFILFDKNFECAGTWTKGESRPVCGYDFWYQPKFDVMVSSEWGAPNRWRKGFAPDDINYKLEYGRSINFYKWSEQKLIQTINLGDEGITPLEIRFLHNPNENQGYVGCGLYSNLYHFYKPEGSDEYVADKVVDIPAKKVSGWMLPELNGLMGDIVLSLDDRFLYMNNWLHGDIRQYDITERGRPRLTGQIFLGGISVSDSGITVTEDLEMEKQQDPVIVKGKRLEGGPQMMQLSLDGKRLFVSSSLFSKWDKQFYPNMVKNGGHIVLLDVDTDNGGLTLNQDFLIDFTNEPYGPALPHEMRYPGGDCTSDIWLAESDKSE